MAELQITVTVLSCTFVLAEFLRAQLPHLRASAYFMTGSMPIAERATETVVRYATQNPHEFYSTSDPRIPLFRRLRAELRILRSRMPEATGDGNEITAAMLGLSAEIRDTVVIAYCARIEDEVAAAILDVPWSTVRSRMERGRSQLCRIMSLETGSHIAAQLQ